MRSASRLEEPRPLGAADQRGQGKHRRSEDVRLDGEEAEEVPWTKARAPIQLRELIRHRDNPGYGKRDAADVVNEASGAHGRTLRRESSGSVVRRQAPLLAGLAFGRMRWVAAIIVLLALSPAGVAQPPKATLATFSGQWTGHTRSFLVTRAGRATEVVDDGCCTRVLAITLQLSKPAGTTRMQPSRPA